MRKPGKPEKWEQLRNIAANMIDQEMKPVAIAAALEVDAQTVRSWRRMYLAGGRAALASGKSTGRPAKLNEQQREDVARLLLKTPAECGFDKYLWTTQLIAELVERETGVRYHNDHVSRLLGAMGFTHQKPARRARERDEVRIEAWRKEVWPDLLKKVPMSAESS